MWIETEMIGYRILRQLIGYLGVLLPFLLVLSKAFVEPEHLKGEV